VIDQGHSSVAQLTVYPGDVPPQPEIEKPSDGSRWSVGEPIEFAGSATEGAGEPLASARLYWRSRLFHCPGGSGSCHAHPLQVFPARESGTLIGPDHDLPSHIELTLTATDARGLSATKKIEIFPRVAGLTIKSDPPGLTLSAGLETAKTPFAIEAIEDSKVAISAPQTVEGGGATYTWAGWSDGGARSHQVVAKASTTYTATYSTPGTPPPPPGKKIPPKTKLGLHPGKSTLRSTAKFSFWSDQQGSKFRCKLDSKPYKPCRSPIVYKGLRPKGHLFSVFALSAAGVADSTPATFRWRIKPRPKR
jgi:hypothetical protein